MQLSPPRHRALGVGLASAFGWGISVFFQLYGEPLLVYLGVDSKKGFLRVYEGLLGVVRVCEGLLGFVRVYWGWLVFIRVY